MSEIRVDSITDEAGTGSPDFINGLTVQGRPVETGNTTVRQTVLSGPVDSDGRADFLSAGTGLQVISIGSAPLNITFGDGFNDGKQRNFGVSIDSNLTWGDLPDDEDAVFLVLEIDGETVTPIHTTLEPHYGLTRPDTPSEGQLFYPTDHRHQMERYDGSEWKRDKNWIVVGECATSGGSVVETRSYAYQGSYISDIISVARSSSHNFTHNIGTEKIHAEDKFSTQSDMSQARFGGLHLGANGLRYGFAFLITSTTNLEVGTQDERLYQDSGSGLSNGISANNGYYQIKIHRNF